MIYNLAKTKLTISIILLVIAYLLDFDFIMSILLIYIVVILYIYRHKKRYNLFNDKAIHIPVDGKITSIERLDDSIAIMIENFIFDIGTVVAPMDATYVKLNKINGLVYPLLSSHANKLNEKINCEFIRNNNIIKMKICSGIFESSICHKNVQDIKNGDIFGHVIVANIMIYLPNDATLKVNIGDNIKQRSILGYF